MNTERFPGGLGFDGRFGYDELALYWREPECRFPLLTRCELRAAPRGVSLRQRVSPVVSELYALDVAEFFGLHGSVAGRASPGRLPARGLPAGCWTVRVPCANAECRAVLALRD